MPPKKEPGIRQREWERHSRDEERAIEKQQATAGASHEPVGETIRDRVRTSADAATLAERQRCEEIVQRWFIHNVPDHAVSAVRRVLQAIAAEIRDPAAGNPLR
jgi:hypothetical protein